MQRGLFPVTLMRYLTPLLLLVGLGVSACDANENRQAGVCYCDFASGDESEYDLTELDRSAQQTECRRLDGNAAAFGGRCELE